MITLEKLKIYKKYLGNIEAWDRFGKKKDKVCLNYEEWELIDELIQNLELIEKDLASDSYKFQVLNKLNNVCDNENTKEEIKSLVGEW